MSETNEVLKSACHNSSVTSIDAGYKCNVCGKPCETVTETVKEKVEEKNDGSDQANTTGQTSDTTADTSEKKDAVEGSDNDEEKV